MKHDNKTFQEKYEAWKNGADYWKDIRGINLGGDSQVDEPTQEEQAQMNDKVNAILAAYSSGKDDNIAEEIVKPMPYDTPMSEEHPILHKYKGGKSGSNDSISSFVSRLGPLVGQELTRYGYGNDAYYNVMRQLAYESSYGKSNAAKTQHNYGGVGWDGDTYHTYKSDKDFVKAYVKLMHNRYDSALRAKSTQDYARALKQRKYYEDSLENYSRNLNGMHSLVRAAKAHRKANPDAYNYAVNMADLEQDYIDAQNASPIIINTPSTEQPATIRADVPSTLLGPSKEEMKAQMSQQIDQQRQQMLDNLTTSPLPNILTLLPQNNFGKDAYGQKFWQRRGRNLHFKGGKDNRSFADWARKASRYKGIQIEGDITYDYRGWYNENPNRAYALLNDDPSAHFGDKWKTPYHPTFSVESIYSNAKTPGGHWGRFDGRDAYYAPPVSYVSPDDRIGYLNMAEDNGVIPFANDGSMYRLNGDLYGGVLPAVQVIGKRGKK